MREYDDPHPFPEETKTTEGHLSVGIGFGVEFIVAKRIGLNFQAGYGAFENFENINVTVETGLFFKL